MWILNLNGYPVARISPDSPELVSLPNRKEIAEFLGMVEGEHTHAFTYQEYRITLTWSPGIKYLHHKSMPLPEDYWSVKELRENHNLSQVIHDFAALLKIGHIPN